MAGNVHIRTSLRRPVRTLLLCLLIGLAAFGFISRAAEYIILLRETERLGTRCV